MKPRSNGRWRARLWWLTGWFGPLLMVTLIGAVALRWIPVTMPVQQLLTPDEATVPVTLLIAGPIGVAIQATLIEPSPQVWALASGHRRWVRHIRVAALLTVFLTSVTLAAPAHLMASSVILLTLAGEAIITGKLLGYRLAWICPAAHAVIAALMGTRPLVGLAWWAWPAQTQPTTIHLAVGLALLALGLLAETRPSARTND